MAKPKAAQSAIAEIFKQAKEVTDFSPMTGPQIEHFRGVQNSILNEAESFAEGKSNIIGQGEQAIPGPAKQVLTILSGEVR